MTEDILPCLRWKLGDGDTAIQGVPHAHIVFMQIKNGEPVP